MEEEGKNLNSNQMVKFSKAQDIIFLLTSLEISVQEDIQAPLMNRYL